VLMLGSLDCLRVSFSGLSSRTLYFFSISLFIDSSMDS